MPGRVNERAAFLLDLTTGAGLDHVLWARTHLSEVYAVVTDEGEELVLKSRPASPRIGRCVEIHAHLWSTGFPCPQLLRPPIRLGQDLVTVEQHMPGGSHFAGTAEELAEASAWLFRRLVAVLPPADEPLLRTSELPWIGWPETGDAIWPPPDDLQVDLNKIRPGDWIDDIAKAVTRVLRSAELPQVIAHGDWESNNVKWAGQQVHAVFDWDSLVHSSEAVVVGSAGAVFSSTGEPGSAATVGETALFLRAYESARDLEFSALERQIAWAAGLWTRAFNAKKDVAAVQLGLMNEAHSEIALRPQAELRLVAALSRP
jgi:Phosphotransferase enzyme family